MSNVFYSKFSEVSGERLDPLFYSGEIKGFFSKLSYPLIPLNHLIKNIESGIGAGKNDQSDKENGILHIRPTNINNNGYLSLKKNIYIPSDNKLSKVKANNVLFNNTNSQEWVGKSIYIEKDIESYFSNHITKIEVKDVIYGKYLWIILNFYQSKRIFYNLCTNWNNQSGIGLDVLKKLKIPIPNKDIQLNIVKKIDNAIEKQQQKEQEAQRKLESIDSYLLDALGIELPKDKEESLEDRIFFRKFSEVSGDRVDPTFYKFGFKKLLDNIKKNNYTTLKHIVKFSSETWNQKSLFNDTFPYIEISEIDTISGNIKKINYIDIKKAPSRAKMIIRNNDIIVSTTRPNRGAISLIQTDSILIASTGFSVIRDISDEITKEFLFIILKSSVVLNQFSQRSSGGNYPAITQEEISKVTLPLPSIKIQNKIVKHITTLKSEAKALKKEATEIYNNAKLEVEKMILGEG